METETLQFVKLNQNAITPSRSSEGAVGYDLHSAEDCLIQPSERRCVSTGLAMSFPSGTYGRIASRSGIAMLYGVKSGAGIIDRQVKSNQ